ncbi:EAL domain-containing protein [Spectribacter hydrogenooxidans]|uniref:EAL domain-containing protein n=1 Tax=Spectribacter hydrogenoxidans TaxID=3075608 RepID=A0ABU3BVP2_9GAMM|nr:EAL domain-containing protein [Salinisphaera sp. W335]MDT0633349.1 EAL domain-containing protein [Salinisphaera sp. W335]
MTDTPPGKVIPMFAELALRESERRFQQAFDHAPIGFALVAPDGRLLAVNRELCVMLEYDRPTLLERDFQSITHPDDLAKDLAHVEALLEGRADDYRIEKRYITRSGAVVEAQLDVSLLRGVDGRPIHFLSQIQDITARKQQALDLAKVETVAQATLSALGEGVIRCDADGRIADANAAALTMLDVGLDAIVGEPVARIVLLEGIDDGQPLADPVVAVLARGDVVRLARFARLNNGSPTPPIVTAMASPIRLAEAEIGGAVLVLQDVGELHNATEELIYLASHDALTGLLNRSALEKHLRSAMGAVASPPRYLLHMNLDHFRTVNDICGTPVGDRVLEDLAALLQAALAPRARLARLSGDEFAALVTADDRDAVAALASELIDTVDRYHLIHEDRPYTVSLSVGIARLMPDDREPSELLVRADAALDVARQSGRHRVHFHSDDDPAIRFNLAARDAAQRIHRALEQDGFELHLQAIVDAAGQPLGYEALLRLRDGPDMLPPGEFLPAAKHLGLMPAIDEWVINASLDLVGSRTTAGQWPAQRYLSINLSAGSVSDPLFGARLLDCLRQRGPPVGALRFEITETDELRGRDYEALIAALRAAGYRVWLDDFGSGYNTFELLKRLPVDGIKIDGLFTRELREDPIDAVLVAAIADVGRRLAIEVVAEGVEDAGSLEVLTRLGLGCFQGFYFHRGESAAAALARPTT